MFTTADLKRICKFPLHLKIIVFFHKHPSTIDTARGIAAWLNHDQKELGKVLDYLVSKNILTSHSTGSTTAYGYTQDREIVKKIEKFLRDKDRRREANV